MPLLLLKSHRWTYWEPQNRHEIHIKWNNQGLMTPLQMLWVRKSQNIGRSLFWRALRCWVVVVVHLHQMSRVSPLSFHTPHPTHTPTGLTWKIMINYEQMGKSNTDRALHHGGHPLSWGPSHWRKPLRSPSGCSRKGSLGRECSWSEKGNIRWCSPRCPGDHYLSDKFVQLGVFVCSRDGQKGRHCSHGRSIKVQLKIRHKHFLAKGK